MKTTLETANLHHDLTCSSISNLFFQPSIATTAAFVAKALLLDMDNITTLTLITLALFATLHVSITCVLLTCLPCCSRLPLKEIACVAAVKARDFIAEKPRWLQRFTVFPLVSPEHRGERGKWQKKTKQICLISLCIVCYCLTNLLM